MAGRVGVLIDDIYGADALDAATGRGWWVGRPVEQPGSNPLVFEHGAVVLTSDGISDHHLRIHRIA